MFPYVELPPDTRVLVHQSDRAFTSSEVAHIREKAELFLLKWSAHGQTLRARIEVVHNQFVAVMIDESSAAASGCSLDKLTHFVRRLEYDYNVTMLDSLAVSYREDGGIACCGRDEFIRRIRSGEVTVETIVFNNLVRTKDEFERNWEVPLKESWHSSLLSS